MTDTDSHPLLLQCSSAFPNSSAQDIEAQTPNHLTDSPNKTSTLDETIERCIGNFGWLQFLQVILVSLAWVFDAQQTFISVFADADPTWHCTGAALLPSNYTSYTSLCRLPKDAWSWDFPAYTSIVSEWSLECAGSFITGLPASSFFMGCLTGGFLLATLADSFLGRKNLLVISCLLMSLSGLLTVVSTNVWIYAALRFLSGIGRATLGSSALVLSTELVGKRWRGQVGVIGFFCFTFGFLSLPIMAYMNRASSWRLLYIWTCVPALLYSVAVHFFARESPRWLYMRGHHQEFAETMKSISTLGNRSSLTLSFFRESIEFDDENGSHGGADLYSSLKTLWEKSWAFRRLAAVMAIGFGSGMVYYGMPLGVGSLAFNLYLSVTLNALSEFPAALVVFFLIGKLNRKGLLLGFAVVSGICSLLCAVVLVVSDRENESEWLKVLQIGLESVSFFSACTAFNVLLIYTLELFPTCVRSSAMSMVRQAVMLGGSLSPLLAAAGRKNGLYSYGLFGVTIASCGLFVGCLPETKGRALCDAMEGEEDEQKETERATVAPCTVK